MENHYHSRSRQPRSNSGFRLFIFILLVLVVVVLALFGVSQYFKVLSLNSNIESLEDRFDQIEQENVRLQEQYEQIQKENERLREENEELLEENRMMRSSTIINHGNRDTKKVAITIDDGAGKELVRRTLDYLKEHNVSATLFPMGSSVDHAPDIWNRAVEEGHELGNHTYSHAYLTNLNEEQIRSELNSWQEAVDNAVGEPYRTYYFRPPGMYGFTNPDSNRSKRYQEIIAEKGMFTVLWDIELVYALRNETATPARITEHVLSNAQGGSIVLLHFTPNDINALPDIITGLRARGLEPCSLRELLLADPEA